MSESDDENFVTYGNALESLDEESLPRKKPVTIEDQYALDPQGRRRFHGAFTGGFSAGYFNTVDTRDGWRPQQFKSSRSSKAGSVAQRPEDFMDEEDTSEFGIAPTAIRANSDYTDHGRRGVKRERYRHDENGPIPGVPVLKELLKPVKDTVGVTLLKKMGWRPGHGIGPRVTKREKVRTRQKNDKAKIYGCSLPQQRHNTEETDSEASDDNSEEILFAPDDYEPFICNPKDNNFGIGYTGLDRRPVLSGHVNLFDVPASFTLQEKNKKLSIRGQAFGVGAFEADDEDIYQRDDMSRYDFSLGPEKKPSDSRWSKNKNRAESSKENHLEGFVPASKHLDRKKIFEAPELPKDFQAHHAIRKSRFFPPIEPLFGNSDVGKKGSARPELSATDRARILGESVVREPPKGQILPGTNKDRADSRLTNAACNIITRTLNLHGREQVEERKLQESQRESTSAKWLEKLSSKSFVSGGVEGKSSSVPGRLNNLESFKAEIDGKYVAKPFVSDPEKQARFEKFLELTKKGERERLESLQPLSMTEWEREHEKDEFAQAARIFEAPSVVEETPKIENQQNVASDPTMSGKFVGSGVAAPSETETVEEQMKKAAKMKLFGKLTRTRELWQPASIVCKRFNIAEPRAGCPKMENPAKNKRFSVFDSLEFCGVRDKFEGATDTAGTSKEPRIPSEPLENESSDAVVASRSIDSSDIDASSSRSTGNMRSFEASYEKIFGRGTPSTSTSSAMENINDTDLKEQRENSIPEAESKTKEMKEDFVEKKDLFKAIFLSSSEESDSENGEDEDDSETVKSLLIGKSPGQLNVQRNTSPPRGIFAKLDLESLARPGNIQTPAERENPKKVEDEIDEKKKMAVDNDEVKDRECEMSSAPEIEFPPDMYGPALPKTLIKSEENTPKNEPSRSRDPEFHAPVFKSVVVTTNNSNGGSTHKGKWVERRKPKKSKKEKHKHKHKQKERSRQKHKSKKDKR